MLNVAIVGYGNLGKSLYNQLLEDKQFSVVGVYSRRKLPLDVAKDIEQLPFAQNLDVLFVALGSFDDAVQYAKYVCLFDSVDSYDNHANMQAYKRLLSGGKRLHVVGAGWDPGVLSLVRGVCSIASACVATTWGKGISQGHSNALRKVTGVVDGVQVTKPNRLAKRLIARGVVDSYKLHDRICYVCCKNVGKKEIKNKITSLPDYFANYKTTVHFVSKKRVNAIKKNTRHVGRVFAFGKKHSVNFTLHVSSNTHYTAQIMIAYAKAISALKKDGYAGALDVLDIPLKYLCKSDLL